MEKTGTIVDSLFVNEWKKPDASKLYYIFDVTLDNGDKGSVFAISKKSPNVKMGNSINYTLEGRKMKVISVNNGGEPVERTSRQSSSRSKYGRVLNQTEFLGYSFSYAKDLIIAGKSSKDIAELNKVARMIYQEIGLLLQSES